MLLRVLLPLISFSTTDVMTMTTDTLPATLPLNSRVASTVLSCAMFISFLLAIIFNLYIRLRSVTSITVFNSRNSTRR